ncbi:MAG TPA: FG-GAP-like repeat-containing protein [Phycisphaerales bacterium]|nr:FG-GAP-like repeat-containing protein [Phycisphaerales bacterium]
MNENKAGKIIVILAVVCAVIAPALYVVMVPRSEPKPAPLPPSALQIEQNNRGVGLMGRYEYREAAEIFRALVEARPDWLDVRVNLAIATLNRQEPGDEDAAMQMLAEVLQEDPNHLRAHYCSGLLYLHGGEPDRALPHFKLVAERDPADAHAAYYIGQIMASEDYAEALAWFSRAMELDPHLRSAHYGASQMLRRLGRDEDATAMLTEFERLRTNPRASLAEFVYTRMGRKGEAIAIDMPLAGRMAVMPPGGSIFADAAPLLTNGDDFTWRARESGRAVSMTACDITGNGLIDIFIAGALDEPGLYNAVCIQNADAPGTFTLDPTHPLARIPHVNAALWGDFDNDGLTDVYLCRRGPNMLLRRVPAGSNDTMWVDVTDATGTSGGDFDTVDGLFFDADHDGDLDVFLVNTDGPNELLSNNRDASLPTFRPIAQQREIAGIGSNSASRQVIAADLDGDRDLDIIVINEQPPHEVYINDRLWQYRSGGSEFDAIRQAEIAAMVAVDMIVDGQIELYGLRERQGRVQRVRWTRNAEGVWQEMLQADPPDWSDRKLPEDRERALALAVMDVNGDGQRNVLSLTDRGGAVWNGRGLMHGLHMEAAAGWGVIVVSTDRGPSVVGLPEGSQPVIWHPGSGRYQYATLSFTGREDAGHSMRSNASGIGTHYAARFGSHWVAGSTLPSVSGPGQSHQPQAVGVAGHRKIDFLSIDWSDGIFQSEIDLAVGEHHVISETQRQLSSCPVLFVWNGEKFEFVSDVLGVGGMGFAVGPGEYAPSRPWERFKFTEGVLQPKHGRYIIKLGEPMEEACYLDSAKLVAYDLPPGWSMTLDERMGIGDPAPTGATRFYQRSMSPTLAVNERGEDVTQAVQSADLVAAPVGELDLRFIGLLKNDHAITITFPEPLDSEHGDVLLIADGWVEYPYSQTMFAAWQAGATYRAPTIEAMNAEGEWIVVWEQVGYPAGMPREMSVPLPADRLPPGTRLLRITTNQEIYWDRFLIAWAKECPDAVRRELPLVRAELMRTGFAQRLDLPQRLPYYDYDRRVPLWDTRHQTGFYTEFGDVLPLIRDPNGALAIFGPGEEVHMEFAALNQSPDAGWRRFYVLETEGWCKDMDLFTKDGDTLEPLPVREGAGSLPRQLHMMFNTRFRSGR